MEGEPGVFVLDSFAVLAYLSGEAGMKRVQEMLENAARGLASIKLSMINLGEVLYITEREVGLAQAQAVLAAVEQLPVEILPATNARVLAAAHLKANHKFAYADAFAAAAALELNGTVLTGDPEFKEVEGLVPVEWLPEIM
jgi:ribonuclease VapC